MNLTNSFPSLSSGVLCFLLCSLLLHFLCAGIMVAPIGDAIHTTTASDDSSRQHRRYSKRSLAVHGWVIPRPLPQFGSNAGIPLLLQLIMSIPPWRLCFTMPKTPPSQLMTKIIPAVEALFLGDDLQLATGSPIVVEIQRLGLQIHSTHPMPGIRDFVAASFPESLVKVVSYQVNRRTLL